MIYDKMCSPSIFLIIFSYCPMTPLLKKLYPILVPSKKSLGDLFSPCEDIMDIYEAFYSPSSDIQKPHLAFKGISLSTEKARVKRNLQEQNKMLE